MLKSFFTAYKGHRATLRYKRMVWLLCLVLLLLPLFFPSISLSRQVEMEGGRGKKAMVLPSDFSRLREFLNQTIATEKVNTQKLEQELNLARGREKDIATTLNIYNLQLSAFGNLLLQPGVDVPTLEQNHMELVSALEKISLLQSEIVRKRQTALNILQYTKEQLVLNQNQLNQIDSKNTDQTEEIVKSFEVLIEHLQQKIELLKNLEKIYSGWIDEIKKIKQAFEAQLSKFDRLIEDKTREELFQRKENPFLFFRLEEVEEDMRKISRLNKKLIDPSFWKKEMMPLAAKVNPFLLGTFVVLFFLALYLIYRFRNFLVRFEKRVNQVEKFPWRIMCIVLFRRTIIFSGMVLFLFIYSRIRGYYYSVSFSQTFFYLLLSWLITKWFLVFFRLWNEFREKKIPGEILTRIQNVLYFIRFFVVVYLLTGWLAPNVWVLLFAERFIFEFAILVCGVRILKLIDNYLVKEYPHSGRFHNQKVTTAGVIFNGIVISGILMELSGYSTLAVYWFRGWGLTATVGLWGVLIFFLLYEWDKSVYQSTDQTPAGELKPGTVEPVRRFLIRLCWFVWGGLVISSLIFSWGGKPEHLQYFYSLINRKIEMGGLNLSVLGFVYAALILLLIQAIVNIWKTTLLDRIVSDKEFEPGLKNSIKITTVYIIWTIGVLLALNLVGIGMTSITVIFGALGIGIGFGLKNIFDNFVSGIILLFERPIQVGDAVEINGIWGEVKRINIRSTWVQTYDNASLIIPNSQFISSQVTNWSFKDKRVRCRVTVGVSYGSDVRRVKEILLDIADSMPEILKYPKPYVLFLDFGESSLIFQLRFWNNVDWFIFKETDVRFEILRRFSEEGIVIPFPQRDIHIYSENIKTATSIPPKSKTANTPDRDSATEPQS